MTSMQKNDEAEFAWIKTPSPEQAKKVKTTTQTKIKTKHQHLTSTYKTKNIYNKHPTHSPNPNYSQPHSKANLDTKHIKYHKILHPNPRSKYQPHPKNTTASAHPPRHTNTNAFHFINWKSNSITSKTLYIIRNHISYPNK